MSKILKNLKYTKTHEWAESLSDGTIKVGITDHAQDLLGDMVFVEIPDVGKKVVARQECAVVESVKAASDVYSPIDGEIVEVNGALSSAPELINQDPYGEGWIFRIKPTQADALNALLDASAYEATATEAH